MDRVGWIGYLTGVVDDMDLTRFDPSVVAVNGEGAGLDGSVLTIFLDPTEKSV